MRRLMVALVALAFSVGPAGTLAAGEEDAAVTTSPAGSLVEARFWHTATPLPDGRVLIVGGFGTAQGRSDEYVPDPPLASAEVWDSAIGEFASSGSLAEPRVGHTATPLPDGRVLVVGGLGEGEDAPSLATAEVWDPATGEFTPTGSLAEARLFPTVTLLHDGRVLVVGGVGEGGVLASAEVWDPATASFSPTGSLPEPRIDHTATLLPDGRVLVIGGWEGRQGDDPASAEVWDPVTGTFAPAGSLAEARSAHTASLLSDGRVFVVGGAGEGDTVLASAEVWDPKTDTFSPAGSLIEARLRPATALLPDGRVLVVGGADYAGIFASAEVWDPATGTFAPAGSLAKPGSTDGPP